MLLNRNPLNSKYTVVVITFHHRSYCYRQRAAEDIVSTLENRRRQFQQTAQSSSIGPKF